MNTSLVLAAVGLALVGAVHSVLGEILVFRSLRLRGVVPRSLVKLCFLGRHPAWVALMLLAVVIWWR